MTDKLLSDFGFRLYDGSRDGAPGRCIYVLAHQGAVQYVGYTCSLRPRWQQHRYNRRFPFDACYYLEIPLGRGNTLEPLFHQVFQPARNKLFVRRPLRSRDHIIIGLLRAAVQTGQPIPFHLF
jgi:hypothetical protein